MFIILLRLAIDVKDLVYYFELIHAMQVLLRLEKIYKELSIRYGGEPSFIQWAAAAGVDQITLRRQINYGTFCKDKMIKCNVRLVISIAKNYLKAGMNLQDLVQVPTQNTIIQLQVVHSIRWNIVPLTLFIQINDNQLNTVVFSALHLLLHFIFLI